MPTNNQEHVEKTALQNLLSTMSDFIQRNPAWDYMLPVVKSVDVQHHFLEDVRLSLHLEKRFHRGFQKEALILSLDVIVKNGKSSQNISVGERTKILTDIANFHQDIDPLHKKVLQTYMGFDYPRRWE